MPATVPLICLGLGPIGRRIAAAALSEARVEIVGAVDVDPKLVGRPLAEFVEGAPDLKVHASLAEALPAPRPEQLTVIQATGSRLEGVEAQLRACLDAGVHVVSTCEELAYPFARAPELARELNEAATAAERTIVGTGINPGFLMDQLPIALTGASHAIRSIRIRRLQDPRRRREPFQRKVGMDIPRGDWERQNAAGDFGHVGLIESGRLLAAGLGWTIEDWDERLEAVQPDPAGLVLGTRQTLAGRDDEGRSLHLHFEAQSGVAEDVDEIVVEGTPPLHLRFLGGVFGDDGTAAAVLRAARVIASAPRGLVTVLDLPLRARPEFG